jgi:hypothetical protein
MLTSLTDIWPRVKPGRKSAIGLARPAAAGVK